MTGTKQIIAGKLRKNAIAVWHGDDPSAMIVLLGDKPDEAKLLLFGVELLRQSKHTDEGVILQLELWAKSGKIEDAPEWEENWDSAKDVALHLSDWADTSPAHRPSVTKSKQAALLRCLFHPPTLVRERVACPGCGGMRYVGIGYCSHCQGSGTIPGPLLDPICRTSTVMGLAAVIRGGMFCGECGTRYKETTLAHKSNCRCLASTMIHQPPHFDRLPVLGDALEDAGADPELVHHCRAGGPHVAACWSLEAVLGSN